MSSIKKCCENCSCHFPTIENCTLNSEQRNVCLENNFRLFEASEKAIRNDERKILTTKLNKLLHEKQTHEDYCTYLETQIEAIKELVDRLECTIQEKDIDLMFEKINYSKLEETDTCLAYINIHNNVIAFFKDTKEIKKCIGKIGKNNIDYSDYDFEKACEISLQEYKVINKVVEALGWII